MPQTHGVMCLPCGRGGFPKERIAVKREEKKEEKNTPIPWEAVDPKPPVIRSGHLENQIRN